MGKKAAAQFKGEVDLAGQVDRLGDVRAEKGKLEKEEKDLKKILAVALTKEGDTLAGRKYEALVVVPDARTPDNKKVIKALGLDWFIANASVALGVLSDKLGDEDLDKIVTTGKGAPQIRTKKI